MITPSLALVTFLDSAFAENAYLISTISPQQTKKYLVSGARN
jgi:hypothetical protein